MFYSLFLSTGPFSGGWVAYPPLSALPQASSGSGTGMTLWIMSLTFLLFPFYWEVSTTLQLYLT